MTSPPRTIMHAARWAVISRIAAAAGGGYIVVSVLAISGALLLDMAGVNRAEAVLATSMASFPVYAVVVMAVFHARTATRAWIGLVAAGLPLALFSALYDRDIPWASLFMP